MCCRVGVAVFDLRLVGARLAVIAVVLSLAVGAVFPTRLSASDVSPSAWSHVIVTSSSTWDYSIAMDSMGDVYVAGNATGTVFGVGSGHNFQSFTAKYSPNGTLLWNHVSAMTEGVAQIAADGAGNAFVLLRNGSVSKYDPTGNQLWNTSVNCGTGYASAIAVDPSGNAYVTGPHVGTLVPCATKLDPTGTVAWSTTLSGYDPERSQIAVNAVGNLVIADSFSSDPNVVTKLDSNGDAIWSSTVGSSLIRGMTLDGAGNTYFLTNGTVRKFGSDVNGLCLFKYDASNNLQWNVLYDNIPPCMPFPLAVDSAGAAYLATDSMPISKYDASGRLVDSITGPWREFTDVASGGGRLSAISQTNAGIAVIGNITGVPEPSAVALLLVGAIALAGYVWRRRRV